MIDSLGVVGGAEQQLVANLKRFTDPRLTHGLVCIYVDPHQTRAAELPFDLPVTYLWDDGGRPKSRLELVRRLDRAVGRLEPALLHCSLPDAGLATRLVGGRRRIPVIESLVNISHEPVRLVDNPVVRPWKLAAHRLVDRATMRFVTRFHALSPAVARSWHRFAGVPPAKTVVIPRGVDLSELAFPRDEARRTLFAEFGLAPDTFLVLAVGRHEPQKGQRYLVEAFPQILAGCEEAVLMIAGQPGSMTSGLERRVAELGLGDRVRLLGSRTDVPRLLAAADVFAFPSLFEGLGVSLLQAMASGRACVSVDRAPMNEVIDDGLTGLLVPAEDPDALAAAVLALAADPGERLRLGAAAAAVVAERYAADAVAAEIEKLYLSVLGLPLRSPGSGDSGDRQRK